MLELKLPPVALLLAHSMLMGLVAKAWPGGSVPASTPLALVLALAGTAVALAVVLAFRRASTTMNPTRPGKTSCIVSTGIYRRSRNPMYLGFVLALAGWASHLGHIGAWCLLPVFVLYMNRFQIAPEERLPLAKFGADYRAYLQAVRRWI